MNGTTGSRFLQPVLGLYVVVIFLTKMQTMCRHLNLAQVPLDVFGDVAHRVVRNSRQAGILRRVV